MLFKYMKKISVLLCAICTLFILQSCLKLVSDEFPEYKNTPTVNAILRAGEPINLHLTYAGTINAGDFENIDKATVFLFVNNNIADTLQHSVNGFYHSELVVESGKEYRCIIAVPGHDTLRCSQLVPELTPVFNFKDVEIAGYDEEGRSYSAYRFSFQNDKENRNFFEVIRNELVLSREDSVYRLVADNYMVQIEDPVFLNEGIGRGVFSDEILNDPIYTLHYNFYRTYNYRMCKNSVCIEKAPPEFLEFRSVSEDYYRYYKQLELYYLSTHTGFEGTLSVFPLYSNIENGQGIFAAYSFFKTDTIYPFYEHEN